MKLICVMMWHAACVVDPLPGSRWFRYSYSPDEECHKENSFSISPGYSCRVLNFTSDGKSEKLCAQAKLV